VAGDAQAARTTVCGAKQGFRDSPKVKKGGVCVKCSCKTSEPAKCTLYPASSGCCPEGKTPHHLIPKHVFYEGSVEGGNRIFTPSKPGCRKYDPRHAPCICVTGRDKSSGQHRSFHVHYDGKEGRHKPPKRWKYSEARNAALASMRKVAPFKSCSRACIKAQLDNYHQSRCCVEDDTLLKRDCHTVPKKRAPRSNTSIGTTTE